MKIECDCGGTALEIPGTDMHPNETEAGPGKMWQCGRCLSTVFVQIIDLTRYINRVDPPGSPTQERLLPIPDPITRGQEATLRAIVGEEEP